MTAGRRALIVIDVQNEYVDGPLEVQHPDRSGSIRAIARAIDAATAAEIPIAAVQHEYPEGAPLFARGSAGWDLQPEVAARVTPAWARSTKSVGTVFADEGLVAWLRENDVDTVTLVGYMTNNCVLASAAGAEPLGIAVEVLSDATGAIHLANAAGSASARQVHETLMVLLHSNFAAVATTEEWEGALAAGEALPKSDLVASALSGREEAAVA
ncbi:isochorismatase family protein [Microbacterium karelineae]|uniref:isochorismatase family protein n=1 Tax=Microbacterium karelineae TaxID=2654283 RepID=UPI0012E9B463|nr:isochorismatase family protein [Microbacterium karelineae]